MSPRVFFVSPVFHGYWRSIAAGLEANGLSVTPYLYDDHGGFAGRLSHHLRYRLPGRLSSPGAGSGRTRLHRDTTRAAVEALRATRADLVLVLKGDLIGADFWAAVQARRLPSTLWLYDEIRRTDYTYADLAHADRVVSYSRLDTADLLARGFDAHYLANAFDDRFPIRPVACDDVIFIGARYPSREAPLTMLHRAGVPVRAVGRDWSHHPLDRLRTMDLHTLDLRRPDLPAARDVDRGRGYDLMAGAVASLNFHSDQDGFTMRTFEAPGAGALQLIDRPDVAELYEPGEEVVVFDGDDELVEACRRAARDRGWARRIGERARSRTLAEHTFTRRMRDLVSVWA